MDSPATAAEDKGRSGSTREGIPLRLPWGTTVIAHKPYPNEMRDHLANVRTFLAWVRTAIAMMGFPLASIALSAKSDLPVGSFALIPIEMLPPFSVGGSNIQKRTPALMSPMPAT